ncbi:MAG: TlpA disulfide reductase family protein [Terricaulis sp.]
MQSRRHIMSTAFAGLALAACGQSQQTAKAAPASAEDPRPRSYAMLNQPAPDFALPKLGGGTARLADYANKVVILYFGGLWCPDCVADAAHTNQLAHLAEGDPDVAFLNIHTQNRFGRWGSNERGREFNLADSSRAIASYFSETGYRYPVAFDATRDWAHNTYAIAWSPSFVIVDRAGVIRGWRTDLLNDEGVQSFFAEARGIAENRATL